MRHIRVFAGDGVGLYHPSLLVLIPGRSDMHPLSVTADIGEVIEIHEHTIFIYRHIVAQLIHKVENNVTVLIDSPVVVPVFCHQPKFLALILDVTSELLAILESRWVEVDEEIDDGR